MDMKVYDLKNELHAVYHRLDVVLKNGATDQRALANQLMDDIVKVLKFANRYKVENLKVKTDDMTAAAKKLCDDYIVWREQQQSEYDRLVAEYDDSIAVLAEEQEQLKPPANDLVEHKSNVAEVVKMEEMNNAPKNQSEGQVILSLRGGKREGSGRKPVIEKGVVRKVSITLPAEEWEWIDELLKANEYRGKISLAKYFHDLAIFYRDDFTPGKI